MAMRTQYITYYRFLVNAKHLVDPGYMIENTFPFMTLHETPYNGGDRADDRRDKRFIAGIRYDDSEVDTVIRDRFLRVTSMFGTELVSQTKVKELLDRWYPNDGTRFEVSSTGITDNNPPIE